MARGGIAEGTPAARSRKPEVDNRQPSAGSRKSALRPCPPLSRGRWRAPIYFLAPHCLSGGRGPRSGEGGLPKARRKPSASSQQPIAGSRQLEAIPVYSLAPHCLSGGRGPRSGEGGLPKARRQPEADSREPSSRQRITHTSSYSNSDTLRLRFPSTIPYSPGTSG